MRWDKKYATFILMMIRTACVFCREIEYNYKGEYLIEVYSDCYEKNSEIFSAINYVNSFYKSKMNDF